MQASLLVRRQHVFQVAHLPGRVSYDKALFPEAVKLRPETRVQVSAYASNYVALKGTSPFARTNGGGGSTAAAAKK
jgi:hypothetical protein